MNLDLKTLLLIAAVGVGGYFVYKDQVLDKKVDPNVPGVVVVAELKDKLGAAVVGPDAKADAAYFASVFESTSNKLVALRASAEGKALIKDRSQVEALVKNLGAVATTGKTKGKYPGLPPVIAWQFTDPRFPKTAGEMTETDWDTLLVRVKELQVAFETVAK
jgi:hypothetical protein